MNDIARDYEDAYRLANGENIKVRVVTTVRYYLPKNQVPFTAKQIQRFTRVLIERVDFIKSTNSG